MTRWKPYIYVFGLMLVVGVWDWKARIAPDRAQKDQQARALPPPPQSDGTEQRPWSPDFGELIPVTQEQQQAAPEDTSFEFPDNQAGQELELADSNRLRLMATSRNRDGQRALVREVSASGDEMQRYLLAPGDEFQGILVSAIAHGYVELAYQGKRFRLTIFEHGES